MIKLIYISIQLIAGAYGLLMAGIYVGLKKIRDEESPEEGEPEKVPLTVLVVFRDEQENLPALLSDMADLDYPPELYEVLMIDDASTDGSVEMIEKFKQTHPAVPLRVMENRRRSASAKKDAILTGVEAASYDWILTTDADVRIPSVWLKEVSTFIGKHQTVMFAGKVRYAPGKSLVEEMQYWDWAGLQAWTVSAFGRGKPVLASAANMGFRKDAFLEVGGYEGNTQHPGGDDVFLLSKMKKRFPGQLNFFLHGSAVTTYPEKTWASLCRQRVRWAEKTSGVKDTRLSRTAWIVFLYQWVFVVLVAAVFWKIEWLAVAVLLWLYKSIGDVWIISEYFTVSGESSAYAYWRIFLVNLFYPFFTVCVVMRMLLYKKYRWKGREFSV